MLIVSPVKTLVVVLTLAFPMSAFAQSIDEAIGTLAEKLGTQLSEEGTERLAIYGFSDLNGFESALGDFISEELTTSLFGAGDFAIVERNEFERVLSEHERYASDIFDSETIAELGEFLAIQALITGSVTQFEDSIRINARAIDVATARVFAAASTSVARDNMVNSLINQRSRSSSTALAAVPGSISQSAEVGFEDDKIRLDVTSVLLWEDGHGVSVTTELHNKTDARLFVTASVRPGHSFATTKHGDTFEAVRLSDSISTHSNNRPDREDEDDLTVLDPGKPVTIVWKAWKREGNPILGNQLVLQAVFQVRTNGAFEKSQVILDNISLR